MRMARRGWLGSKVVMVCGGAVEGDVQVLLGSLPARGASVHSTHEYEMFASRAVKVQQHVGIRTSQTAARCPSLGSQPGGWRYQQTVRMTPATLAHWLPDGGQPVSDNKSTEYLIT